MVPHRRKALRRKPVKRILCRLVFIFIQLQRGHSTSQGQRGREIFGIMQKKRQVLHMDFSTFVALLIKGCNLTELCKCLSLHNFIYFNKTKNITYILSANLSKIRA